MFTFKTVLGLAGVDLKKTRLVRHQDNGAQLARTPYDLWRAHDGRFEVYQSIQERPVFKDCDWIAAFVATPLDETLFVGLYRILGTKKPAMGLECPARGTDIPANVIFYDTSLSATLQDYIGRIEIEWGPGYRTWVQRADRQEKPITAIHRSVSAQPFPGFDAFIWPINLLSSVPASWRPALSAVSGIYVLTCRISGRLYVGSAVGQGGFWQRWQEYHRTGHGGNQGLKEISSNDFQVSILEFGPSTLSNDELLRMESRWKEKLLSKEFGLNRN